jgi:hypothetical protein
MKIKALAALSAVAVAVAGCSSTHVSSPDPAGSPGTNPHVIQEPYGFRNVSFSCFGPNGVYVTSRSIGYALPSGITVVPNDPQCK